MVRPGSERGDDLRRAGRVAQAHREVAQPAFVTDAPDRRAGEALVEVALRPAEEFNHGRSIEPIARLEVRFIGRLRKPIPWADELAVVAAVDPVADERPQLFRDGALVLDREIRDAAARIELVRRDDPLRRADVDAAPASAAMLFARFVRG